jgi:hypothetical protein
MTGPAGVERRSPSLNGAKRLRRSRWERGTHERVALTAGSRPVRAGISTGADSMIDTVGCAKGSGCRGAPGYKGPASLGP